MIRIALSSDNTLKHSGLELLRNIGIRFCIDSDAQQVAATNFPLEIVFMPETDIPALVAAGLIDLAIVGRHLLNETTCNVTLLRTLNINRWQMAFVGTPHSKKNNDHLNGRTIATSLPNTLAKYLKDNNIHAKILTTNSAKLLVQTGLASLYFEPIAPQEQLEKYNLKLIEKVGDTSAALIATPSLLPHYQAITEELLFRIDASLEAKNKRLVALQVHKEVCKQVLELLPHKQKPAVLPLDNDRCLVQCIMDEIYFWDIAEKLKLLTDTEIILTEIDKIIR